MILLNCLSLLNDLSRLEDEIVQIQKIAKDHGVVVDDEQILSQLIEKVVNKKNIS